MMIFDSNQLVVAASYVAQKEYGIGKYTLNDVRNIFLNYVLDIKRKSKYSGGDLVFAFDYRHKNWRHAAFPFYKAKRSEAKAESPMDWDVVHEHLATITDEMNTRTSFPVLSIKGCEADDIIGVLTIKNAQLLRQTVIVSTDKDFMGLQIYDGVKQWSYRQDTWLKPENPKRFLQELIIKGDTIDCIPNATSEDNQIVSGIRQKAITQKKLDVWIPILESGEIPEDLPFYERNARLIDLHNIPPKVVELINSEYEAQKNKPKSALYTYIAQHAPNLFDRIGEFYQ